MTILDTETGMGIEIYRVQHREYSLRMGDVFYGYFRTQKAAIRAIPRARMWADLNRGSL